MSVSGTRIIFDMAQKLENPINLTLGLPDFDVPEEIKKEAIKHIELGSNKYTTTQGIPELREKLVKKFREKNSIETTPENIIVSSAVSGALSMILTSVINPGDEVILFDPYFVGYKELVVQNQGVPVFSEINPDFSINFENLKKAITSKTKVIILNTPNNPTGYVCIKQELEELARIAKENRLLVISDEIYEDFVYEGEHFSIGSFYENTVTMCGFSKSHAMTGWRVGYITGPAEIISQAVKVQQFNFVCAPAPFQYAAIKALDYDINENIKKYKEKRDIIYQGLKDKYDIVCPKGAFYAFVRYPYEGKKFLDDALKNNLLVVPGEVFSNKDTHFRISFAADNDTLRKAVEVLNKMV